MGTTEGNHANTEKGYTMKKLSLYQLTAKMTSELHKGFQDQISQSEICKIREAVITISSQLTDGGNRRYPVHYTSALYQVASALMQQHNDLSGHLVFGYWYKNEFYTTRKKQCNYTIYQNYVNPCLKTTEDLRNLFPEMAGITWGHLVSGIYYADSLKPYFVK